MALSDSHGDFAPRPPASAHDTLDRDVLDFVARSPELKEFAFQLADHGCVYVGQLIQLDESRAVQIAQGDRRVVTEMREKLAFSGLALGLDAGEWTPPTITEAIEEVWADRVPYSPIAGISSSSSLNSTSISATR